MERTSFSFGGALYGWVYYGGVAAYMQERGLLHDEGRFYATSAGVIPGSLLVCGVDVQRVGVPAGMEANDIHHYGGQRIFFNPDCVRRTFDHFFAVLPPDAHVRASGRLFIVTTELPFFRKRVISHFPTREALRDAMIASVAIPGHGVRFAYRASEAGLGWCIDGGVVANYEDDPREDWRTIRVGVYRARAGFRPMPCRLHISPSRRLPFRVLWSVGSRFERMQAYRMGYRDAKRFFGAWERTSRSNLAAEPLDW